MVDVVGRVFQTCLLYRTFCCGELPSQLVGVGRVVLPSFFSKFC